MTERTAPHAASPNPGDIQPTKKHPATGHDFTFPCSSCGTRVPDQTMVCPHCGKNAP